MLWACLTRHSLLPSMLPLIIVQKRWISISFEANCTTSILR
uniref:Uncharacterized protein n=1 Tax=Ascaris lumbricoides TaxID=6252 RepID=A0A0M3I9U0_ASCLU